MTDLEGCKAAMDALEQAFRAVFAVARAGMTADEVDAALLSVLRPLGAELLSPIRTPFVVAEDGAPPKMRLDRVPLQRGRLWGMDNSVRLNGYSADLGRYGYFGAVPETLSRAHLAVLQRQDEIAAQVAPGRSMEEIFRACSQDMPFEVHRIQMKAALPPICGNSTQGALDETKRSTSAGVMFEPGQVACVEVWAGMMGGIEDMYLVESSGIVRISTLPRTIHSVPETRA